MYSIIVLICSTALSHADCQAKTAVEVVRGPTVDNPMMCALNAQTMIARTDLVQANGTEYVKVVCTRKQSAEEWVAEISARKAAIQEAAGALTDFLSRWHGSRGEDVVDNGRLGCVDHYLPRETATRSVRRAPRRADPPAAR